MKPRTLREYHASRNIRAYGYEGSLSNAKPRADVGRVRHEYVVAKHSQSYSVEHVCTNSRTLTCAADILATCAARLGGSFCPKLKLLKSK